MFFKSKNKKAKLDKLDLKIAGKSIERVKETKFLGIFIDERLDWSHHIAKTRIKIAKGTGIIFKAKKFLNESTLITLYYSFVYPYLHYGIIAWGNTYDTHLDSLIKIQKRAIRLITHSEWLAHTAPLFHRLKLLNLKNIYTMNVMLFMFKCYHGMLPPVFDGMFILNSSVHVYHTRQSNLYHSPKWRLEVVRRSVRVQGVAIWNMFASKISHECSIATFKHHVKYALLNK